MSERLWYEKSVAVMVLMALLAGALALAAWMLRRNNRVNAAARQQTTAEASNFY